MVSLVMGMTDQELTLQAVSSAQRILEKYLEPRPHSHEGLEDLLNHLVETLDRTDVVAAIGRLKRNAAA
jgi:hypothetical protein